MPVHQGRECFGTAQWNTHLGDQFSEVFISLVHNVFHVELLLWAQTVPVSHFKRKPTRNSMSYLNCFRKSQTSWAGWLRGENAVKLFTIGGVKKPAINKKKNSLRHVGELGRQQQFAQMGAKSNLDLWFIDYLGGERCRCRPSGITRVQSLPVATHARCICGRCCCHRSDVCHSKKKTGSLAPSCVNPATS